MRAGRRSSTSGELKAEGTRAELVALVGEHDRVQLDGIGDLDSRGQRLSRHSRRSRAASVRDGGLESDRRRRPRTAARADERHRRAPVLAVKAVQVDEPDLEAVFLHLTGKALRD